MNKINDNSNCACDYVVQLTAIVDDIKLNQFFTESLKCLILDAELIWEFPIIRDIKELNYSAININLDDNSTKVEMLLGCQAIAKCSIDKPLSKKEKIELKTLAEVFINQKRHISLSSIDQLTGVLNRQAFSEKVKQLCQQTKYVGRRSKEQEKCLAILDVDHFKQVNDRFGHLIGDEVLIALGQKLNQAFRDDDLTFRYGGEEFAIILTDVNIEQATRILDRFRKAFKAHVFPQVGQVTISIGIANYEPSNQPTELIGKADRALYYAKENGRDQVFSYQDLIVQRLIKPVEIDADIECI